MEAAVERKKSISEILQEIIKYVLTVTSNFKSVTEDTEPAKGREVPKEINLPSKPPINI